jgi:integrase
LRESAAFAMRKKYRLLMARFERFSNERGYVTIDQWEPLDVRQFRSTWPVSPQTAVRRMAMLKPFFEYCVSNKWIATNPARAVKNPKGREMVHSEQKFPFTDDELKRMYSACERYGTILEYFALPQAAVDALLPSRNRLVTFAVSKLTQVSGCVVSPSEERAPGHWEW